MTVFVLLLTTLPNKIRKSQTVASAIGPPFVKTHFMVIMGISIYMIRKSIEEQNDED
jgi:hypothetical protein